MESAIIFTSNEGSLSYERYLNPAAGSGPTTRYPASKVIVAIPAYNEEIAIGSVVLRTLRHADEVVVIDDGSMDCTAEVARLAGAKVLTHAKNEGKGAGVRDAFAYAMDNGADILVLMDGDGQHDPGEIPRLIEPILDRGSDFVNGSRCKIKNKNHAPAYRQLGQRILDRVTNAGTGQDITDTQSGFRAFARETFGCFSFRQNGMGIESEMLMDAAEAGLRIREIPINVRYDVDGSTYHPVVHGLSVLCSIIVGFARRLPAQVKSDREGSDNT